MKKLFFRVAATLSILAAPLLIGNVAKAAPDTCTWTGGGTASVIVLTKTISFNIADAANWSGCDNGNIPEAGDSLVFPAGLAVRDPGNEYNDDAEWRYVVSNTIGDSNTPTSFASITFSGSVGNDNCSDNYNNSYTIAGNPIAIGSGGIVDSRTGSCLNYTSQLVNIIWTRIDISSNNTVLAAQIGDSSNYPNVNYGTNNITIGFSAQRSYLRHQLGLFGTGSVSVHGYSISQMASQNDEKRDIRIKSGSRLKPEQTIFDYINNMIVENEATLNLSYNNSDQDIEVPFNISFEGGGGPLGGGGAGGINECSWTSTIKNEQSYEEQERLRIYNYSVISAITANDLYYLDLYDIKISGSITFENDLSIYLGAFAEIAGPISSSGKKIDIRQGSFGNLVVNASSNNSQTPNGTLNSPYRIFELSGKDESSQSEDDTCFTVNANTSQNMVMTDGTIIGSLQVNSYGKLNGVGTVRGPLYVAKFGILAPGMSPGCINSGNLSLFGIYEVELGGLTPCTQHDQMKVSGSVNVTGATLVIYRINNMVPAINDSFVIIDNDGSDEVIGTFDGLDEGDTITTDGVTYTITYKGGDGNDVVLVVTDVDESLGAPNTGFKLLQSSLLLPVLAIISAIGIIGLQRLLPKKIIK